MIMLRSCLLLLLLGWLLPIQPARAQRSSFSQDFAGSTVLLATGDTLQGPLTFNPVEDVIRIQLPDNTMSTLSAVAVQSFAVKGQKARRRTDDYDFFDARQGYYYGNQMFGNWVTPMSRRYRADTSLVRVYRVYRWNHDRDYSDYKAPGFFEQLSNGPQVLLRREVQIEQSYRGGAVGAYGVPMNYGTYTQIDYKYYLGTPGGNVLPLRNPKKDLLAIFRPQARQIEQYAKDNKLSFTDPRELAYIVNYINSLQKEAK